MFGAGCGIRLYWFLILPLLSTLQHVQVGIASFSLSSIPFNFFLSCFTLVSLLSFKNCLIGQQNYRICPKTSKKLIIKLSFISKLQVLFEFRKITVCFLWLSLPADCRVTDEALLAETT